MKTVLDTFRLDGKVIIVTGAAGLLGTQYCRAIEEAGGISVAADKKATGEPHVDVTDKASVQAFVRRTLKHFGRIDGLVNNAGIDPKFEGSPARKHTHSFEDYPLELWNQSLDVNITGMFLMAQTVAPVMLRQGKGSIVNIASTYALVGPDQRLYPKGSYKPVAYSVTKSAVLGLTRYLAAYWAGKGIRVNTLTPGGVFHGHDKEFVKRYSSRTPLGRMAKPDEYNAAIVFLLSDASSYMTGSNLVIDGGWTAW